MQLGERTLTGDLDAVVDSYGLAVVYFLLRAGAEVGVVEVLEVGHRCFKKVIAIGKLRDL